MKKQHFSCLKTRLNKLLDLARIFAIDDRIAAAALPGRPLQSGLDEVLNGHFDLYFLRKRNSNKTFAAFRGLLEGKTTSNLKSSFDVLFA